MSDTDTRASIRNAAADGMSTAVEGAKTGAKAGASIFGIAALAVVGTIAVAFYSPLMALGLLGVGLVGTVVAAGGAAGAALGGVGGVVTGAIGSLKRGEPQVQQQPVIIRERVDPSMYVTPASYASYVPPSVQANENIPSRQVAASTICPCGKGLSGGSPALQSGMAMGV